MIRLFRKIRHQLLSEDRYSIYLLYATGEIILVVIGILIALQIDNWNDNRKQTRQIDGIYQSLQADLIQDTVFINSIMEKMIADSSQLGDFVNRLSGNNVTIDTLIHIARYEFNPHIHATVTFSNNTFSSLNSTGLMRLLDQNLQGTLLKLNELQQESIRSLEVDLRAYMDQASLYTLKYPFKDFGHIHPDSKLGEMIWQEAEMNELATYLNGLIGIKYATVYLALNKLVLIKSTTETILKQLEEIDRI